MKTNNPDVNGTAAWTSFVSNGCGYLWYKYVGGLTEDYSTVTCNIAIMRYAEVLLTYAEAKIELGELMIRFTMRLIKCVFVPACQRFRPIVKVI